MEGVTEIFQKAAESEDLGMEFPES